MSSARIALLVAVSMLAFAGNSLLCRHALRNTAIDANTFAAVRLVSGAIALWLLLHLRQVTGSVRGDVRPGDATGSRWAVAGSWTSAAALFAYALFFSLAYLQLSAATGALLLFGSVQLTMIGVGLARGERLQALQALGLALAVSGLVSLLLPGLTAPPLRGAALMIGAGLAWGVYSLRGRGGGDPLAATMGNFVRAAPLAMAASLGALLLARLGDAGFALPQLDWRGTASAVASGAAASGVGYAVWYGVLPHLTAVRAAVVQLSVPVIAAIGGVLLLGEAMSLRLALCALATLGGVGMVIAGGRRGAQA